jgi:predicted tellurium resistance membrane protein TerC
MLEDTRKGSAAPSLFSAVVQIRILDVVFALDSIITAVGLAEHLSIMVTAVVII